MLLKPTTVVVLLLFTLGVIRPAQANEPSDEWELMEEKWGIKAYKQRLINSDLYAFKGEGTFNSAMINVANIILNNDRATEWVPNLSECKTALKDNQWPVSFSQYSVFDAPWPVRDRYFLSRINVTVSPDKKDLVIRYDNIPSTEDVEISPPSNAVKGRITGSEYYLTQRPDGKTDFTAISRVDPKGNIPGWLINWIGKNMPFDMWERMEKRLKDPSVVVAPELYQLLN